MGVGWKVVRCGAGGRDGGKDGGREEGRMVGSLLVLGR